MIHPPEFQYQPGLNAKQELTPAQKKMQRACTEFEAMMVKQMLEAMMKDTKMFGTGFGGEFYRGMFEETISESIAKQGIGLGKMLYQQLEKTDPVPNK